MAELSEDEVIEILGPVSDALAAEIIATGIDKAGLVAARDRVLRDRKSHTHDIPWSRGPSARSSISWSERAGSLARAARRSNSAKRVRPAAIAARPGGRTGGSYQVMVMTTAAAAATRMAMAAVSTVMEVAKVVISQSRRALNAPRWGGTVGIAGRECMECPPQRIRAGNA